MRQLFHVMTAALARLSPREQRLVGLFALLLACAGIYVFVIEPVTTGRSRAEQRIAALDRDVIEMRRLAARIREVEESVSADSSDQATAGSDFSLFSFIDRATSASVSRDAIASMNPARRAAREGYEESTVELRLTSVTLAEVVGLLREIENATEPVYVKRVELKRRYDDNTRFDALILTGSVSRT